MQKPYFRYLENMICSLVSASADDIESKTAVSAASCLNLWEKCFTGYLVSCKHVCIVNRAFYAANCGVVAKRSPLRRAF